MFEFTVDLVFKLCLSRFTTDCNTRCALLPPNCS